MRDRLGSGHIAATRPPKIVFQRVGRADGCRIAPNRPWNQHRVGFALGIMSEFSKCSTSEDTSLPFPSQDSARSVGSKKWPHGPQGEPIISVTTIDYSPTRPSPFTDFRVGREAASSPTEGDCKGCHLRSAVMKIFGRFGKRNRMGGVEEVDEPEQDSETVLWNGRGPSSANSARDGCIKFFQLFSCGLLHFHRSNNHQQCSENSDWWMGGGEGASAPSPPSPEVDEQTFTIRVPECCSNQNRERWGVSEASGSGWDGRMSLELVEGSDWSVQKVMSGVSMRFEDPPPGFTGNALMGVERSLPKDSTWLEIRGYMLQMAGGEESWHPGWGLMRKIAAENEGVPCEEDWQRFLDVFFGTSDFEFRSSEHWERLKGFFLKPMQALVYVK